ncbi:MAG: N-acetylmuramoyl-L-alanine amidase, partial [Acidobacteria bacterium]|nr:N-acetylmuramoyl-L-alanine amidase [Acidobacteriota bacterium]
MAAPIERDSTRLFPSALEKRARRIEDPIARLRYLRQATEGPPARRRYFGSVRLALFALAITLQIQPTSDATVHTGQVPPPGAMEPTGGAAVPDIWLVEATGDHELYSNGLRVEKRFAAPGRLRAYRPLGLGGAPDGPVTSTPAGIVFHATENQQAPFGAEYNHRLQMIGEALLEYVRDKRAYHYVIDRFGRVYGTVPVEQVANHAGHSVWADERWLYVNLNASFIGVSFEAQTSSGGGAGLSQAQLHAGRALTDMLRSRFHIATRNCVTHAQVSINPGNMRLGYHTDWEEAFPFAAMGLRDNYALPVAAVYLFGFAYEAGGAAARNASLHRALAASQAHTRDAAA